MRMLELGFCRQPNAKLRNFQKQNIFGQLLLNAYLIYRNIGMTNCNLAGIISVFQKTDFFMIKIFYFKDLFGTCKNK